MTQLYIGGFVISDSLGLLHVVLHHITIASLEQQDNRIYFILNITKSLFEFENVYLRVGQLTL